MSIELSEQEVLRRQSLKALRELGINPYPAARFEVNASAREIAEQFDPEKGNFQQVSIAGRIMSRRIMGSASFFELQDATGRIQVYIRRDDICPEGDPTLYNTVFKKLLDIGDFIGVEGFAFHTNTGELSVHCQKFTVLSKSVRPLPVVKQKDGQTFDALTDPEVRYRQRYLDLVVNPHVKDTFIKRAKIMQTMRDFFNERGYLEVETPILQPIPGGAAARPFITHHNALDIDRVAIYTNGTEGYLLLKARNKISSLGHKLNREIILEGWELHLAIELTTTGIDIHTDTIRCIAAWFEREAEETIMVGLGHMACGTTIDR